jgi:hypothetical protein
MKKYIFTLLAILLLPFLIRPKNVMELYAPFHDRGYLLAAAIMPERNKPEFFEISWPSWFIRGIAKRYDFNFSKGFENRQSSLQFILVALYDHEKRKSLPQEIAYVLSMAQRSINEGANINNVAAPGLSALHEAVLFNSVTAVKFLISNGADCNIKVSRPGRPIDGMNALEMTEYLSTKSNENRSEVLAYLRSQQCNKRL